MSCLRILIETVCYPAVRPPFLSHCLVPTKRRNEGRSIKWKIWNDHLKNRHFSSMTGTIDKILSVVNLTVLVFWLYTDTKTFLTSLAIGWRERNQQDATNPMFIIKLLSQHVSGIIMPIIRWTRVCTAAYGALHWLWWLWLCGAGTQAVCTVKVTEQ